MGGPGSSLEVFPEQPHGALIKLWTLAEPPLWGKRATLVEPLEVTVDCGAVDPEPTGGFACGDAPSDGLHYLGAQVH